MSSLRGASALQFVASNVPGTVAPGLGSRFPRHDSTILENLVFRVVSTEEH